MALKLNKTIMVGKVSTEPTTTAGGGRGTSKFVLAVRNEGRKHRSSFKCIAIDETSRFVDKYVTQGDIILVEGYHVNEYKKLEDGSQIDKQFFMIETLKHVKAVEQGYDELEEKSIYDCN